PADYRSASYKRSDDNSKGAASQRKVAYDTGRAFVTQFGAVDGDDLRAVKKWVADYEAAAKARAELYKKFQVNRAGDADQQKAAYGAAKEFISKYDNDPDVGYFQKDDIRRWKA